ncbi:AraC family transcriptional regulator [Marinomonas sp. 42_23_T18]|nr:AraC family transcriptional regulator [Marinomonas sp. 42_23_T18]
MSRPSSWPIPNDSVRYLLPRPVISDLKENPLSKQLYPVAMGFYKKAQGHSMFREKHDDYLLIYCVNGEGLLKLNNKSIKISSGDLVVLPKSIAHEYAAKKKTPWSIYWVHLDGTLATNYITQISKQGDANILPIGLHSRLITDFEALLDTRLSSSLLESHLHSCSLLSQIITYIALLYKQTQHKVDKSLNLEAVKSLMLTHIHQQLDIDTLASTANLSKFHFIKRYKALTGRTPINDFIQMKIERACHLLDISDKSIATIGLELGYEDAYYFSRVFNKIMGISPTQYRSMRLSHA